MNKFIIWAVGVSLLIGLNVIKTKYLSHRRNLAAHKQKEYSLKKFKNEKGGECAKSIFTTEGIIFGDESSISTTLPENKDEFFGAASSKQSTKSCLLIK